MPEAFMTLEYEGPAVDSGAMDVRRLAPALIATSDAIRIAWTLLGVEGRKPQVHVRALRPGSFIVDLLVADSAIASQALTVLTSKAATATSNLEGLVALVVSSIAGIRWLQNRKIIKREQGTLGRIRIYVDENTMREIEPEALELMIDAEYRRSVRAMMRPLSGRQGIQNLTVRADNHVARVASSDLPAFTIPLPPPAAEEILAESEAVVVLRPVNIAFAGSNKWRFNDGETTFDATVQDVGFLSRVDAGTESFAKNDMLRVSLRTRQTVDANGGIHTGRVVTEVLEHLSGAVQLDAFASTDEPPSAPDASA